MAFDIYERFAEQYDLFYGRFSEHDPEVIEFFRKLFSEKSPSLISFFTQI